jgi:hypothetical protein
MSVMAQRRDDSNDGLMHTPGATGTAALPNPNSPRVRIVRSSPEL